MYSIIATKQLDFSGRVASFNEYGLTSRGVVYFSGFSIFSMDVL